MLNVEDIMLALKDAGVAIVGGPEIAAQVAKDLQEFAAGTGVQTGHDLMMLLNNKNESDPSYCFYIAPHESEEGKVTVFSLDYPETTLVIRNSVPELIRVGQEIIYEAHQKLMAVGAVIQPPVRHTSQEFPEGAGVAQVAMGDLYALRLLMHNVRIAAERTQAEPDLYLDIANLVYLH